MDLLHIQLVLLLCLLLGNLLFGSLPLCLGKIRGHFSSNEEAWNRKVKWSTFLEYIGAGVFIADSFLVLLPQANQDFSNAKENSHNETGHSYAISPSEPNGGHHHDSFPMPEFIVLWAFFLVYILQELIHLISSKLSRIPREASDMRVRFCSCAKRHTECSRTFKCAKPDQTLFGMEKKLMESAEAPNPPGAAANMPLEVQADPKAELLRSSILAQAVPNYGTVTNVPEPAIDNPLPALTAPVLLAAEERRLAIAQQSETIHRNKFLISCTFLVLTLSLQYIFLGVRLGLYTEHSQQWQYLLVVCLQNFILTFSASSYFALGNLELRYLVLFSAILSTVTPIGMIISMEETKSVKQIPHLAEGIVSAVACGTLLYATFYEMLRQKHFGSVVGLTKFLAIALGAGIMIALQYASLIL